MITNMMSDVNNLKKGDAVYLLSNHLTISEYTVERCSSEFFDADSPYIYKSLRTFKLSDMGKTWWSERADLERIIGGFPSVIHNQRIYRLTTHGEPDPRVSVFESFEVDGGNFCALVHVHSHDADGRRNIPVMEKLPLSEYKHSWHISEEYLRRTAEH